MRSPASRDLVNQDTAPKQAANGEEKPSRTSKEVKVTPVQGHAGDDQVSDGGDTDVTEGEEHEDEEDDEQGNGHEEADLEEASTMMQHSRATINDLGFEILDTIFSYFSTPGSTAQESGQSHYDNQQNLLAFCQVNRAFYRVARLHLSRYIPIASTFKARQLLSLCEQSKSFSPMDSFGSRVHSLLLVWPDQGKYSTRRTSVITEKEFHSLLISFNSLRNLELICLPYPRLDDLNTATIASLSTLDNLRSLSFNGSPFVLSQKEEYSILNSLLGLVPNLEHLSIINIPLNSLPQCTSETAKPIFRLKTITIKLSSPRIFEPDILEWILGSTTQAGTCQELVIWLSKKCTDRYMEYSPSITSVKENEGFRDIEIPLSKLSPSLRKLSIMGLRTGQASAILSKTTRNLKNLQLYDTFGYGVDILNDFPLPSGLEVLEILPNPSPAFGAPPPVEPIVTTASFSTGRGRNNPAGQRTSTRPAPSVSSANQPEAFNASNPNTTTGNIDNNDHTPLPTPPHTFTEIPISSSAFIAELGRGNRLENLKVVRVPDNARFGKRGKWNNKELNKACRRLGIVIEEIKMAG